MMYAIIAGQYFFAGTKIFQIPRNIDSVDRVEDIVSKIFVAVRR